eukprot:353613-Chlamydomonas_euryale.AAC.2
MLCPAPTRNGVQHDGCLHRPSPCGSPTSLLQAPTFARCQTPPMHSRPSKTPNTSSARPGASGKRHMPANLAYHPLLRDSMSPHG